MKNVLLYRTMNHIVTQHEASSLFAPDVFIILLCRISIAKTIVLCGSHVMQHSCSGSFLR